MSEEPQQWKPPFDTPPPTPPGIFIPEVGTHRLPRPSGEFAPPSPWTRLKRLFRQRS